MADNLIPPRFSSTGLPLNYVAVNEVINNGYSISPNPYTQLKYFTEQAIATLENLKGVCIQQERDFFKILNIPYTLEGFKELNNKLRELHNDAGVFSNIGILLGDINVAAEIKAVSAQGFDAMFEVLAQGFIKDIQNNVKTTKQVIQDLSSGLQQGQFFQITRGNLSHYIDFKVAQASGQSKIQGMLEATDLSSDMRTRIISALKEIIARNGQNLLPQQNSIFTDNKTFCDYIRITFVPKITNSALRQELDYILSNEYDSYAIGRNESVLRGFLGEVWATAAFRVLTNQRGVIPTGPIKDALKSQSIGIDLLVQGFGFQIKRYTLDEKGIYEIQKTNQEGGSLIDRAELPFGDALKSIFAAYQFNQPFSDDTYINKQGLTVEDYRNEIYSRFVHWMNPFMLSQLFRTKLDAILRITQTFQSSQIPNFMKQQTYNNTFFIINDNLLPSSLIIDGIIKEVRNQVTSDTVNFEISDINIINQNTLDSLRVVGERTRNISLTRDQAANLVRLNYNITINYLKLFSAALKHFN